jgi:hypothetical protein
MDTEENQLIVKEDSKVDNNNEIMKNTSVWEKTKEKLIHYKEEKTKQIYKMKDPNNFKSDGVLRMEEAARGEHIDKALAEQK